MKSSQIAPNSRGEGRGEGEGGSSVASTLNSPRFLTSYWLSSVKRFLLGYYITVFLKKRISLLQSKINSGLLTAWVLYSYHFSIIESTSFHLF